MAFIHTKKVDKESFIKARIRIRSQTSGSGSDQQGPDPTGSGSATLLDRAIVYNKKSIQNSFSIENPITKKDFEIFCEAFLIYKKK
jgi:hypothetical protein